MFKKITVFIVSTIIALPTFANPVNICDDGAEWPPYVYYERENGKPNKSKITGATYDMVVQMFKNLDMEFTYDLVPWKRCLAEVKDFAKKKKYEMFANASANDERKATYHITKPIYALNQGAFFYKEKFPQGPGIKQAMNMNGHKVCGINGYNYDMFFQAGLKEKVDTGSQNTNSVLEKLKKGRCDFFPASLEPVYGSEAIGSISLKQDFDSLAFPEIEKTKFYLYISKGSPRAEELLTKINDQITKMQANGEAEKFYKKYLPTGTGL